MQKRMDRISRMEEEGGSYRGVGEGDEKMLEQKRRFLVGVSNA